MLYAQLQAHCYGADLINTLPPFLKDEGRRWYASWSFLHFFAQDVSVVFSLYFDDGVQFYYLLVASLLLFIPDFLSVCV